MHCVSRLALGAAATAWVQQTAAHRASHAATVVGALSLAPSVFIEGNISAQRESKTTSPSWRTARPHRCA